MELSPDSRISQNPRTAYREMDGEGVLMVIDRQALHALNEVGARVWALCADGASIDGIAEALMVEFEVGFERAREDVRAFVVELAELGAVRVSGSTDE